MTKKIPSTWWLLVLPAVLLCYLSLMLVVNFRYPEGLSPADLRLHLTHFTAVHALWLAVLFMHRVFDLQVLRRTRATMLGLASGMTVNLVIAVLYFYAQPGLIITPRRFLLAHVALTFVLLLAWNSLMKYVLANRLVEELYLFSNGHNIAEFIKELQRHPLRGLRLAGTLDSTGLTAAIQNNLFGSGTSLIIPERQEIPAEVLAQFYSIRLRQVRFYRYQELYELLARKVYGPGLNELWFLENIAYGNRPVYETVKRILDITTGLVGVVVLGLVYPLVALAIKLDSQGSVVFHQSRVGKYGTIFTVYKFRTMHADGAHDTWTGKNDPRITRVGRFLRRSRLDELPQAWNLIQGNMSLVGPRPEQPQIAERLRQEIEFYDERHSVKPGLTGWGQLNVYARTVAETKTKLQYDLYYIKHRSFLLDCEIILKTLYHIFTSADV
jgi:exopolysaccharide biosynthesis polyprenyl glycosylphosphotransferase